MIVPLRFQATYRGRRYSALVVRRPTLADRAALVEAQAAGMSGLDMMALAIATLCDVPGRLIAGLDFADFVRLCEAVDLKVRSIAEGSSWAATKLMTPKWRLHRRGGSSTRETGRRRCRSNGR
jgi:hypothetical protein